MNLEEQIQKLNRIGIALSNEHNLNNLLALIVTEARQFTNADGGSLYIKKGHQLDFTVAQTESLQGKNGKRQPFEAIFLPFTRKSIAGYVAITGKVLNIPDVYHINPNVGYRFNMIFDQKNNYRSQSMLVVPMRDHEHQVIGVLQLINSIDDDGEIIPFKKEYESLILSLASQAAVAIRNVKLIEEIKNLFRSLVRYSAKAIDARSPQTAGHSGRVAKYCVRIAEAINKEKRGRLSKFHFSKQEIEELRMAGWLHDIGKIGVRESVLEKMYKLSPERIEIIAQRFETVRNVFEKNYIEKKYQLLLENKNGKTTLEELNRQKEEEFSRLQETLDLIKRVNLPQQMSEPDKKQLSKIAKMRYQDSQGERRTYLTETEYEALSIANGNLTEDEFKEMRSHVEHSFNILSKIPFTKDLRNIPKYAATHHEYLDGSGYPKGLKGEEIPLQSRIMSIADIFDALSSPDRPYKKPLPRSKSLEVLRQEAKAGKLDKNIVDLFIRKKLYQRPQLEEDDS